MAEKQLNLTSIGSLNPMKLRKDDYVLRIEKVIESTSVEVGQTLNPAQRKRVATAVARDILRSVKERTERDIKNAEKDVPKKFRNAVKILAAAGGLCLLSLGVGHYAKGAGLEKYVEISRVGLFGACIVSMYGIKDTLEGALYFVTAKLFRKRLHRFASMVNELEKDMTDIDPAQTMGPHWKS